MKGNYHRVPEGLGGHGRPESRQGQTGGKLVVRGTRIEQRDIELEEVRLPSSGTLSS